MVYDIDVKAACFCSLLVFKANVKLAFMDTYQQDDYAPVRFTAYCFYSRWISRLTLI